jgi:hypothetical protein
MCVSERDKATPRADETLPAKDFFDEEAPAGAQGCRVLGENEAQFVRHREHPLTKAHLGEDGISEARGGVAHTTRIATRAHAAPLAGKGEQEFVPAGGADSAGKPVSMNAALEIRAELLFYVARDAGAIRPPTLGQESFQVVAHEGKEHRLFGAMLFVLSASALWHALALCEMRTKRGGLLFCRGGVALAGGASTS